MIDIITNYMKDCPGCYLVNPNSALRCDCGYDFPSGTIKDSYLQPRERRPATNSASNIWTGHLSDALFLPLGIYCLYQLHWMPNALSIALPLAQYGAIQAWRYRKYLGRVRSGYRTG